MISKLTLVLFLALALATSTETAVEGRSINNSPKDGGKSLIPTSVRFFPFFTPNLYEWGVHKWQQ